MGELRAGFESWLSTRKVSERNRQAFDRVLAAADACDAAVAAGSPSEEQQALLVEAASETSITIRVNTVELIGGAQKRGADMDALLFALAKAKKANARLSAVSCLEFRATKNAVMDEILVQALGDKNGKVSFRAARVATIFYRKKWMAPLMAASGFTYFHSLLTDGYVRKRLPDGSYRFEVLTVADGVKMADVPEETVRSRGIEAIVAELRMTPSNNPPVPVEESRVFD